MFLFLMLLQRVSSLELELDSCLVFMLVVPAEDRLRSRARNIWPFKNIVLNFVTCIRTVLNFLLISKYLNHFCINFLVLLIQGFVGYR